MNSANGRDVPWIALVYHDVRPEVSASGGGPERFSVPLPMFERVLDTIVAEGYLGRSLADALREQERPRVAITFDDTPVGVYEHAMPALRARGMTATVYIVTDWVGRPGFMTWDQLRQLKAWGMSVQSHTRSHPFLSELDEGALRAELTDSKTALDRELGQDTAELAFPGGDAPRSALRHVIWECGYRVAVGSRWGRNPAGDPGRRFVRRCGVRGTITSSEARRIVRYDPWLALTQRPRETALRSLRSALGPSRYSRWRRRILDVLAGRP